MKEKIKLHEEVINNQYKYGIRLCSELNIPINPKLIKYIKKMKKNNENKLFTINLYNVKKNQKIKSQINEDDTIDELITKRELDIEEGSLDKQQKDFIINIFKNNKWIQNIGEIGFNVGISSDTFLKNKYSVEVISFDIIIHEYVYDAKEFIDKKYPNRHTLIAGNSHNTVPYFHKKFPNINFDLIFIDGDHSFNGAKNDIINMKKLSHKKTILLFDDILPHKGSGKGPAKAWEWCKNNNILINTKIINFSKDKAIGIGNYKI